MPITHHPPDDTVLRYATGTLPEAPAIVVATHLSFCPACRHRMESYEILGGSVLDDVAPAKLSPDALSAALSRLGLDAPASSGSDSVGSSGNAHSLTATAAGTIAGNAGKTGSHDEINSRANSPDGAAISSDTRAISPARRQRPDLPSGMEWPQPLRHYDIPGWRFALPGVKWTAPTLTGPGPESGQLFLVRGIPGAKLPSHGHDGTEYTCVLTGSFSDASGIYTAGDLIEATEDHDHQPIVGPDAECVCIIAIDGHLRLHGLARLLQPFLGL